MLQVVLKNGVARVEEVPAPVPREGQVLVQVEASAVSVGTELSGLRATAMPLWQRALQEPKKVLRFAHVAREKGLRYGLNLARGRLNAGLAVGYSAAGTVMACGAGITRFRPGQTVACAGAGYAMHAEIISVPENLVCQRPPAVSAADGATVALGSIALQGVRRCAPEFGETLVVYGLGLLGLITVQLLRACGCRVFGIDIDAERTALAATAGATWVGPRDDRGLDAALSHATDAQGADAVIVTAATSDPELLAGVFALCRRKARVVLVGDVPITIPRDAIYAKEIDFRISTSYGAGRYDEAYEERGLSYPVGYVRWTENRNMQAYLEALAGGQVRLDALPRQRFPLRKAAAAYASLSAAGPRPLTVVLEYEGADEPARRRVDNPAARIADDARVRVALIGAGGFATTMHLPNLDQLKPHYALRAVVSRRGLQAKETAVAHGAVYSATDIAEVLADADVDLLLVATRHDEHCDAVVAALAAGKAVFVEKPLALDRSGLSRIESALATTDGRSAFLVTGFNRRFAPAIARLLEQLTRHQGPMVMRYTMNAGRVPPSHWTQGPAGGGRNIGEACHIYDLFTAFTGATVSETSATAIGADNEDARRNENFSASFSFSDGSLANLVYTSLGDTAWPKELLEVYVDNCVYRLEDYRVLRSSRTDKPLWEGVQDKGHLAELQAVAEALRNGGGPPIPIWQQLQATTMSFDVEDQLYPGRVAVADV